MKQFFSTLLLLGAGTIALAQDSITTFNAYDFVDAGNIKARVNALGDMWWNPDLANWQPACEFPKGSGKHVATTGAIWMSGYDAGGNLHVAAQTYRQNGTDYWAGPKTEPFSMEEGNKWGKIWKVNKSDVDAFLALPTHTVDNTPASILEWPAKGNPYAKGAAGVSLTINDDMAPFVDADGNGSYDPLAGDYPAIKGDQMLWNIFNDRLDVHGETGGQPLGVTIQQSSYAYDAAGVPGNIVFYEYLITNNSTNSYDSFRVAFYNDLDVGYYNDDYIAFDSARRMGIGFNGAANDNIYGNSIPAMAVALLETPGDVAGSLNPVGAFAYFENDWTVIGFPQAAAHYNGYMHGRNKIDSVLHHDSLFQINWAVGNGVDYQCVAGDWLGDRRFLLSSPDATLPAGATRKYAFALVVSPDAGGCPSTDFTGIAAAADTAIAIYWSTPTKVAATAATRTLQIYPNPATKEINFISEKMVSGVAATNTLGQTISVPFRVNGHKVVADVATLPAGVYTLSVSGKDFRQHAIFVKQ